MQETRLNLKLLSYGVTLQTASFLHLVVLFCKVIFNHASKRQFVVLHFRLAFMSKRNEIYTHLRWLVGNLLLKLSELPRNDATQILSYREKKIKLKYFLTNKPFTNLTTNSAFVLCL